MPPKKTFTACSFSLFGLFALIHTTLLGQDEHRLPILQPITASDGFIAFMSSSDDGSDVGNAKQEIRSITGGFISVLWNVQTYSKDPKNPEKTVVIREKDAIRELLKLSEEEFSKIDDLIATRTKESADNLNPINSEIFKHTTLAVEEMGLNEPGESDLRSQLLSKKEMRDLFQRIGRKEIASESKCIELLKQEMDPHQMSLLFSRWYNLEYTCHPFFAIFLDLDEKQIEKIAADLDSFKKVESDLKRKQQPAEADGTDIFHFMRTPEYWEARLKPLSHLTPEQFKKISFNILGVQAYSPKFFTDRIPRRVASFDDPEGFVAQMEMKVLGELYNLGASNEAFEESAD